MEKLSPIASYLADFENPVTRAQRLSHLRCFFRLLEIEKPDDYFKMNRNYEEDVTTLWRAMSNHSIGARKMRLSCIVNFLESNDVTIKKKTIKSLTTRTKHSSKAVHDIVPTKKEMKRILLFGKEKERALFLTSLSSGLRIQECLSLTPKDINLKHKPARIVVRDDVAKNGEERVTFISNEARDSLFAWLKIRDDYLQTSHKRTANKKFKQDPNDNRIFPIDYMTARLWWVHMLQSASTPENNLAEKDKPSGLERECYKRHIHTLRMYFRTNLPKESKATVDAVETMMGHEGYCNYRRVSEEQCAKEYLKAMDNVTIFTTEEKLPPAPTYPHEDVWQRINSLQTELTNLREQFREYPKETPLPQVFP